MSDIFLKDSKNTVNFILHYIKYDYETIHNILTDFYMSIVISTTIAC